MATLFAHAALPIAAGTAPRRLLLAAIFCSCWQDLDLVTFAFEMRPPEALAHRGAAHSLFAAALMAILVAAVVTRSLRAAPFLFLCGASHGLIDLVTAGEHGVALFWPLSDARITSSWKLLPAVQVGLDEYLSFWGILTIVDELLFVIMPIAIVAAFFRGERFHRAAIAWGAAVVVLPLALPDWFTAEYPRLVEPTGSKDAGNPDDIPHEQPLLTHWDELQPFLEADLLPEREPWSSSFFPSWFGGEAGRWSEPTPRLVWRTLTGFAPPTESEARARTFTLAPAEKIDVALGRFDFPAQRQALEHSHNGHPRFWSGRCNGVAAAALAEREPFRVVRVVAKDGTPVDFHPNDVKALLAVAYYETPIQLFIGDWCNTVSFDAAATCSMNPAVLVVAIANRIGVEKRSFYIDALPTIAKQYYAIARAHVSVVRGPYEPEGAPLAPSLAHGHVMALVDVAIELVGSSTTLSYARADVRIDATRYARVGLVPVTFRYSATLALDDDGMLVGGRWTGDPPNGPDSVGIADGGPALTADGMLVAADRIPWSLVRDLARASVDDAPELPIIDLRKTSGSR